MDKKRKLQAQVETGEPEPVLEALEPTPAIEQEWDEATELDAVDQYVVAHGEFPKSGDIVGPDVVDNTLFGGFSPPDDRPAER
jgi:hypothetical protein